MTQQPNIRPDSSRRGFILPGTGIPFGLDEALLGFDEGQWTADLPTSGQSLDDFLQQVVAGVTGLDQSLVRPRWQAEPPTLPPLTTDWAAIGVTKSTPLGFPYAREIVGADGVAGFSQQSDQEEFDLLCSFYGPHADGNAVALRGGLMVHQNRECLQIANIGLITVGGRTRVPTLLKTEYLMRVDTTATFRREVRHFYPVLFYLSAPFKLIMDDGSSVAPRVRRPPPRDVVPIDAEAAEVFDIPFQYLGTPQAGEPILIYTFVERFSLLGNQAGSAATVPADGIATETTIFDLAINDTNFGMMIFSAGERSAIFAGTAQTFNASDRLIVTPRRTDASLTNISGNFLGTS